MEPALAAELQGVGSGAAKYPAKSFFISFLRGVFLGIYCFAYKNIRPTIPKFPARSGILNNSHTL